MHIRRCALAVVLSLLTLAGCERDSPASPPTAENLPAATATDTHAMALSSQLAWQQLALAGQRCQQDIAPLQVAATGLVEHPTSAGLESLRTLWHSAHQCLLHLAPLFSLGDANPGLFLPLQNSAYLLDAWPIEPGYLDSFDVYSHSGVVNDIAIAVSADSIRAQHGLMADTDVVLGMHAIAYLLWGENGQRPASDFLAPALTESQRNNGLTPADLPANRRAALLRLQIALLQDELELLVNQMQQNASMIAATFISLAPEVKLELWRTAVIRLLQHIEQREFAATPDEDQPWPHNRFAGHTNRAIGAQLRAVRELLFQHPQDHVPLIHWLAPAQQQFVFDNLSSAEKLVDEFVGDWQARPKTLTDKLQSLLQQVLTQLR